MSYVLRCWLLLNIYYTFFAWLVWLLWPFSLKTLCTFYIPTTTTRSIVGKIKKHILYRYHKSPNFIPLKSLNAQMWNICQKNTRSFFAPPTNPFTLSSSVENFDFCLVLLLCTCGDTIFLWQKKREGEAVRGLTFTFLLIWRRFAAVRTIAYFAVERDEKREKCRDFPRSLFFSFSDEGFSYSAAARWLLGASLVHLFVHHSLFFFPDYTFLPFLF